jgi:putative resolvase
VNLTGWAGARGVRVQTAYRWYREGTLPAWAAEAGLPVVRAEAGVGSGVSGLRAKVRGLLLDPAVTVVAAGHRDRLGRVGTELAEAALSAHSRRLVVLDGSEVTGDVVRDVAEVLAWLCAGLYGRWSARNRAPKALGCARQDSGPQAVRLQACSGAV